MEQVIEVFLDIQYRASNSLLYSMYPFKDFSNLTVEEVRTMCDVDYNDSEICDAQEFAFII